jgi:hypothetical protein
MASGLSGVGSGRGQRLCEDIRWTGRGAPTGETITGGDAVPNSVAFSSRCTRKGLAIRDQLLPVGRFPTGRSTPE